MISVLDGQQGAPAPDDQGAGAGFLVEQRRLGAYEAPPAIVSVFLGDELKTVLDSLESGTPYNAAEKIQLKLGVSALPRLPKDTTDRNRTSPLAFTGNKFEFRMVGSSDSIACANIMLNTSVAESLRQFADILEGAGDFKTALHELIRNTIKTHKRIIFNGNGYDESWEREAENRGLLNLKTTPDCLPYLISQKNIDLLTSHQVYSEVELKARYDIILRHYCRVTGIEALTMLDMARKQILPAVQTYISEIAAAAAAKKSLSQSLDCSYEEKLLAKLSSLTVAIAASLDALEEAAAQVNGIAGVMEQARFCRDTVIPGMNELREAADQAELLTAEKYWPYPTYGDLLFSVK